MGTAADFPVKWMHSGMPRAPVLTKDRANVITVLDALLVTGWGAMTPQRIHVEGGVATVQCSAGDTFEPHHVIEVSGAEQPELNGQHRVLTSSATSFTFAADAPDGYATGTVSIKAAAAGWEKPFAGEGKAVYRSVSPQAAGTLYRVENGTARGYCSMSDVDAGEYPFPGTGAPSLHMHNNENGNYSYAVFADDKAVIFCARTFSPASTGKFVESPAFFGALTPVTGGGGALLHEAVCGVVYGIGNQGALAQSSGAFFAVGADGNLTDANTTATFNHFSASTTKVAGQGAMVFSRAAASDGEQLRGFVPGLFACLSTDAMSHANRLDTVRAQLDGTERIFILNYRNRTDNQITVNGM
ncbi:MAG: hypothetical protein J6T92_01320, partial [Ottowia sp.]|nr:hypothetical protein [Ottowia sp.]